MALFASVLAFMFWSLGVTRLGSARSGQFINLMPVFGVILASLVLRKIRRPAEMIGAATRLDRDSQRRVGTSIGLMAFSVALQLLWPFSDLRAVVDARLLLTRDRPTSREVRSFY